MEHTTRNRLTLVLLFVGAFTSLFFLDSDDLVSNFVAGFVMVLSGIGLVAMRRLEQVIEFRNHIRKERNQ